MRGPRRLAGTRGASSGREHIIFQRACAGVGAARSSDEATNHRGAKGPQWKHAESEEQRIRLNDKRSTTEQAEAIYLHWFDKVFHRADGPAHWAKARLVRYADDFVVLARYQGKELRDYIEGKLEKWLGLELNREKTRVVNVKEESLDFLGYTFCHVNSRLYPGTQVLSMRPSKKSVQRQKDALRELTGPRMRYVPVTDLIVTINRQLRGWSNYFGHGYWKDAFHEINGHIQTRLLIHLRGKSQRHYRVPKDQTAYEHLQRLGWVHIRGRVRAN